ncbi:MAG TPA: hypothetical protein VHM90_20580, partial [Phycisphaerae bacterium]|nr:hypothetical protein [Phycisphaerae bacterium]
AAQICLERAAAREPLDPHTHAHLAQVLWKQAQRTAAIERLERSLELDAAEQFYWDLLHHWGKLQGKPDVAVQKARALTRVRGGDADAWRRLARILPERGAESLAAADKAIELEPRNPESYDLRATILASEGRLTEAHAACAPAIYNGHVPAMLRARGAWLLARSGRKREAIAAMRGVLEVDQSNLWAWQRLGDWLHEARDMEGYLKCAKRMAELWPGDAGVLEYLAHARLEAKPKDVQERRMAKAELRRALEIDPDRSFAADRMFDLHLEDKETGSAELALRYVRQQARDAPTYLGEARLALAKGDGSENLDAALQGARKLFLCSATREYHLEELLAVAKAHGRADARVKEALVHAAGEADCAECVPAAAIRIKADAGNWEGALQTLRRCAQGSKSWEQACRAFFIAAGHHTNAAVAAPLVREQHHAMRENIQVWGIISYTFNECGRHTDTVRWMSDYKQRGEAEGWMLMNLGRAYSQLKRYAEAAAVHAHALTLPPDNTRPVHVIWHAIYMPEQFAGPRIEGAAHSLGATLEGLDPAQLEVDRRMLLFAARVRVGVARGGKLSAKGLGEDWKQMGKSAGAARKTKLVKQVYQRVFWEVVKKSRNPVLTMQALGRFVSMFNN